ncbi:MAG: hypothetical protein HY270_16645 [Deltaproteobacteria bacterium]|nr:hypothetical protein [Deltaproteobacteria bacterium]
MSTAQLPPVGLRHRCAARQAKQASLGGVFLWIMAVAIAGTRFAFAVDTGVGRRAAAVASIDPTSAVAGSTEIRSLPGQEGDAGMVQVFRFSNGQTPQAEPAVNSLNGTYLISLSAPLTAAENVYVRHTTDNAVSATVIVQSSVPPSISGPLNPASPLVTGHATPDRTINIQDATSGATLGSSLSASGTGWFSVAVPALHMFQTVRAVDSSNLSSPAVTVLGFSAASNAGIPQTTCPATVVQASGPMVVRFACGLLNPRGLTVLPDGSLRIVAGVPPSGLINYPPPATIKFDPGTQAAQFLSPVTGVGTWFDSISNRLLIARPHLFRLQDEHMVERHDGEILQMNPDTGETTVATRLLDIAPTAIAADTSITAAFGGGIVVSSLFYSGEPISTTIPANSAEPEPSAIWSVTQTSVAPLKVSASPALVRIHGLAVGPDWNAAPALFAAQPGSGTIFRILPSNGVYAATTLISGLGSPVELAFAPSGSPFGSQLYATDADGGSILQISIAVATTSTAQVYVSGLDHPFGLAFSASGLFVTESSGSIVAIYP